MLLVFLLPVVFCQLTEPYIRLAGLLLQLLGISTVLHGVSETRKLFNLPSLLAVAFRWLRSFPKFRPEKTFAYMSGDTGVMSVAGRAILRHQASDNATIEERIRVLESNLQPLDNRLNDFQHQIDETNRQAKEGLATEQQKREDDINALREKLTTTETGGLSVSLMGLVWLIVGVIMSTASPELKILFSPVPH